MICGRPVRRSTSAPLCAPGRLTSLPSYPFHGPALIAPEASTTAGTTGVADAQPSAPPAPHLLVVALWQEYLGRTHLPPTPTSSTAAVDSLLITRLARRIAQDLGVRPPLAT